MHSCAEFCSIYIGASQMRHSSKINARQQIIVLYKLLSVSIHQTEDTCTMCESAFVENFQSVASVYNL